MIFTININAFVALILEFSLNFVDKLQAYWNYISTYGYSDCNPMHSSSQMRLFEEKIDT